MCSFAVSLKKNIIYSITVKNFNGSFLLLIQLLVLAFKKKMLQGKTKKNPVKRLVAPHPKRTKQTNSPIIHPHSSINRRRTKTGRVGLNHVAGKGHGRHTQLKGDDKSMHT